MRAAQQSGYPEARIIIDANGRMEIIVGKSVASHGTEDDFEL